jgi:hypothetical protein
VKTTQETSAQSRANRSLPNSQALNSTKNAPSPDGKDLAQIENALDVLLTELLAERKRQREAPGQKPPLRAFSAAELAAMPILSDREIRCKRIIEDPLAGALELAIRELGEALFAQGGVELMGDVLDRVAGRHPKSFGHRASLVDHAWNGVAEQWWC